MQGKSTNSKTAFWASKRHNRHYMKMLFGVHSPMACQLTTFPKDLSILAALLTKPCRVSVTPFSNLLLRRERPCLREVTKSLSNLKLPRCRELPDLRQFVHTTYNLVLKFRIFSKRNHLKRQTTPMCPSEICSRTSRLRSEKNRNWTNRPQQTAASRTLLQCSLCQRPRI